MPAYTNLDSWPTQQAHRSFVFPGHPRQKYPLSQYAPSSYGQHQLCTCVAETQHMTSTKILVHRTLPSARMGRTGFIREGMVNTEEVYSLSEYIIHVINTVYRALNRNRCVQASVTVHTLFALYVLVRGCARGGPGSRILELPGGACRA